MAVTITNKIVQQAFAIGNLRGRIVDVALATNDYVTNGVAVSAAAVGLNEIYGAVVIGQDATEVGYLPVWDQVNLKLKLHQDVTPAATAAFVEVGNGASTAVTFRLLVIGV